MVKRSFLLFMSNFGCAVLLAGSIASAEPDILFETSEACITNGTDENVVYSAIRSLGWEPVEPNALTSEHQSLYATPFLANAAYKNEFSPSWDEAWQEGLAKAERQMIKNNKPSKFFSTHFFTLETTGGLLQLKTQSLPRKIRLFCTIIVSENISKNRLTLSDPDDARIQPTGVLKFFLRQGAEVGAFSIGRDGVVLNQQIISEILDIPILASAYVTTFVSGNVEK